jgi:tripartite-type tricarboxylate transporter receptor subunit TctC
MKTPYACVSAAALVAFAASYADASTWPSKSVRAVVPYAAGSTADIVPRAIFDQLALQLGQSIIVDNRAGAGGTIGAGLVARATADGHTVLVNSSAHTIAPALYANLAYHPTRDFAAVVPLGISACALVVSPAKGFRNIGDLVAAAKARPAALNFSSVGVGTATHLSAERFRFSAGIAAVHVPFKGGAEAMTEAMSGRVEFFFGPVGLVLPHVKDGRLTALVVNGPKRAAALPEVPTTQEAGFSNAEYPIWFGLFVPAKTRREVVDTLHRETAKALQAPKVRERLAVLGVDPMIMAPPEFSAFMQKALGADAALVKAVGIKAEGT